ACLIHHFHDLDRGGAAYHAVIHENDALAIHDGAIGIVLQLHAKLADMLCGFYEGATNIMVTDDAKLERHTRFRCIANGCGYTGIRYRDHHISFHTGLAGEFLAKALAYVVDALAPDNAVRAREVDIFKHARANLLDREGADRFDLDLAILARAEHHFTGFHLTHKFCPDNVERHGLRAEDRRTGQLAKDQRANTKRIARADEFLVGEGDKCIGALNLRQRFHKALKHERFPAACHELENGLCVRG